MRTRNVKELTGQSTDGDYKTAVRNMLMSYYLHALRPLPENFNEMVFHWTRTLEKSGIPAHKLMDIYDDAHLYLPKGAYFNIDCILSTWEDVKQKMLRERKDECSICKGTKKTLRFDFTTKTDIVVECPTCS